MTEIDTKGLSCPIPAAKTKQAMEKNPSDKITVLVSSNIARENVTRLAESKKYSVNVQTVNNDEVKLVLKSAN